MDDVLGLSLGWRPDCVLASTVSGWTVSEPPLEVVRLL
jgi:radical SAM superfamily enzyme